MQSLITILGAKTVCCAILDVLTQGNSFRNSSHICKRVHACQCFSLDEKFIYEVHLSVIPTSYIVIHIMEQFGTLQTEFFPTKQMFYINRPDCASAANGCSIHWTRLELDSCPHVCRVDSDPQHCVSFHAFTTPTVL